ncbi:MAG: MBL fold metallo-hydrolase [Cyclobacteriaceae bacterium]
MAALTVLGSGDAFATGGKFTTSFFVESSSMNFLVDCGVTTFVRLKQMNKSVEDLDAVFITHFHGDHYGGLPYLLLSQKVELAKSIPLTIVGPIGIKQQLKKLQEALYPETGAFVDELPLTFIEYDLEWQQFENIKFRAAPVVHSPASKPHGIRFDFEGVKFAFSGDTEWTDRLVDLADGTDLFITECNNHLEDTPGHLSYRTLLEKRDVLATKRIVLSHMGNEMLQLKECEFLRLEDGMRLELG